MLSIEGEGPHIIRRTQLRTLRNWFKHFQGPHFFTRILQVLKTEKTGLMDFQRRARLKTLIIIMKLSKKFKIQTLPIILPASWTHNIKSSVKISKTKRCMVSMADTICCPSAISKLHSVCIHLLRSIWQFCLTTVTFTMIKNSGPQPAILNARAKKIICYSKKNLNIPIGVRSTPFPSPPFPSSLIPCYLLPFPSLHWCKSSLPLQVGPFYSS